MVRNLHLLILLCGVLITLQGCINPLNIEEPEPEKGQFKIVLTSDLGQTKAFWEVDPEKRNLGEPCERELHSVLILCYLKDESKPSYANYLSPNELKRKSSIFSLPNDISSAKSQKVTFIALANINLVIKDISSQGNLRGEFLDNICKYYNLSEPTGRDDVLNTEFSSIYPNGPTMPAVALRDTPKGKGFVMSSEPVILQMEPTDDRNMPRTVNLKLARAVSRIEIKAHTTSAFTDKYPGSTLTVENISVLYMQESSVLSIFPTGADPTTADHFRTMKQIPYNTTTADGLTDHNFIFYSYENTQKEATPPWVGKSPQLDIIAKFDFDGDPATSDDATTVRYLKKLTMSNGNGSIFRNTLYQVEIMLNGLSEREVISSIEILPWSTVYEEVHFGG